MKYSYTVESVETVVCTHTVLAHTVKNCAGVFLSTVLVIYKYTVQ